MLDHIEFSHVNLSSGKAPWLSLAARTPDSPTIHISAANGFTPASYQTFLNGFDRQYSITGMDCRGSWNNVGSPPKGFNMHNFADDLIEAIEIQHKEPIIGLGHSQGGFVTLLAAIKRPELFSKIILIEPASLPYRWVNWLFRYTPNSMLYQLFPFMRGSLNRQFKWESPEQFHTRYRHHNTYKRFTDDAFNDYLTYGLTKKQEQYQLTFSPEWEAHIFTTVEFIWTYLQQITIPTLFIKAEHSNLYSHKQFHKQKRKLPAIVSAVEITKTYHLTPYENPEKLHNLIKEWLLKGSF